VVRRDIELVGHFGLGQRRIAAKQQENLVLELLGLAPGGPPDRRPKRLKRQPRGAVLFGSDGELEGHAVGVVGAVADLAVGQPPRPVGLLGEV